MPLTNTLESARPRRALARGASWWQALGFTAQQAEGFAAILEDTLSELREDLATKGFVRSEIGELKAWVQKELRQQMLWFFAVQIALLSASFAVARLMFFR